MRILSLKNDGETMQFQMSKFAHLARLIFVNIVVYCCAVSPIHAQSISQSGINFDVVDQKLSSTLIRLSAETDINFTYNAADSIFDNYINYSAVNKEPLLILDDLLSKTNHSFKKIGNHVVIFYDSTKVAELEEPIITENDSNAKSVVVPTVITKYITRPVYDTIYLSDTVFQIKVDTVFIVDTVLVEKEKPKNQDTVNIKEIPVDDFNLRLSRESGWAGEVFIAPILTDFSLVRKNNKITMHSFSLGVAVSRLLGNWNFKGGLKLTHFGEKFIHSYSIQDGGFFITDTIDEYYTVSHNDTIYYYITDSTWKPISNKEYNYNINNRIGLFEFSLAVSYDFYTNDNLRLYGKLGGQVGVMIYNNGLAIPNADNPDGVDFADLKFRQQSLSALFGVGMKYRLNKNFDINTEINYVKYINDIVIDYPTSTKINGVGIKIGLIYYF